MKNKGVALILSLMIGAIAVSGCAGNSNTSQSPKETSSATQNNSNNDSNNVAKEETARLDLTGNWAQKGKEGDDTFQAGYIADGIIELYWITDGGTTNMLYWSGTYDAPINSDDEYTWDSVNDKVKTDSALMASGDDTKTFSYKNGEISYEVSVMGQSATVTLVRSENDYSNFAPAQGTSGEAQDGKQLELVDSGYTVSSDDGHTSISYAAKIHNPNEEYAVEFPVITITARDADGKILKTENDKIFAIAANDTIAIGREIVHEGDEPDSVEITVSNNSDDYIHQSGSGKIRHDELTISNASEIIGEHERRYTGEVTNNSNENLDNVAITVIYKNGDKIVGGELDIIDELSIGSTKPFEISSYVDIEHDSYEIYALQW